MTGNVAQVFTDDEDWLATLRAVRRTLAPDGTLVFETRVPSCRAWEGWTPRRSYARTAVVGVGLVESWHELVEVVGDPATIGPAAPLLVTFRTVIVLPDGECLESTSTLRFRSRMDVESSLAATGFSLREVRGAPDRPGREHVFIAQAAAGPGWSA